MKTSREKLFIDTIKSLGLNTDLCEAINDMRKVVMEAEDDVSDTTDAESEDVVSEDDSDTKDEKNTEDAVVDTSKYRYQKPGFNVALLLKMKRLGTKEQLDSFLSRYANGDSLEKYAKACAEKDKEFIDETYKDENEREEKKADIDLIVAEIVGKPADKTDGVGELKKILDKFQIVGKPVNETDDIEKLKRKKEKLENDLREAKGELEKLETDKRKLVDEYKSMTNDEKEDASRKFAELNDKHDEQKNNIVGIYGKLFEINKRLEQLGWNINDKFKEIESNLRTPLAIARNSSPSFNNSYNKITLPKIKNNESDIDKIYNYYIKNDGSDIDEIYNDTINALIERADTCGISVYEYIWRKLSADEENIKSIKDEKEQDARREKLREMLSSIMSELHKHINPEIYRNKEKTDPEIFGKDRINDIILSIREYINEHIFNDKLLDTSNSGKDSSDTESLERLYNKIVDGHFEDVIDDVKENASPLFLYISRKFSDPIDKNDKVIKDYIRGIWKDLKKDEEFKNEFINAGIFKVKKNTRKDGTVVEHIEGMDLGYVTSAPKPYKYIKNYILKTPNTPEEVVNAIKDNEKLEAVRDDHVNILSKIDDINPQSRSRRIYKKLIDREMYRYLMGYELPKDISNEYKDILKNIEEGDEPIYKYIWDNINADLMNPIKEHDKDLIERVSKATDALDKMNKTDPTNMRYKKLMHEFIGNRLLRQEQDDENLLLPSEEPEAEREIKYNNPDELRGTKIQDYLDEINRMSPEDFESQREEIEKRIRAREGRRDLERRLAADSGTDSPETTDSNEDAKTEKKPGRKRVQNPLAKPKTKPIRI